MIPKKIHYCWFGGKEFSPFIEKCVNSWREIMPDYEIIKWDEKKFNINSVVFVKEACDVKKWAFAADYIRLYAIYTEGGIYLDTDVIVKKRFDEFLQNDFFSAVEELDQYKHEPNMVYVEENGKTIQRVAGIGMLAAVLGAKAGNKFVKECMSYYEDKNFIRKDGTFRDNIISPDVYATIAQKYGFRYKNELQNLSENMTVYPSSFFASDFRRLSKENYAVHCCEGSWQNKSISDKIKTNSFLRKLFKKQDLTNKYEFVQNNPVYL